MSHIVFNLSNAFSSAIMRTFSMMQEDMSPYMKHLLGQLIEKLAAVSKVLYTNLVSQFSLVSFP